ncbi:MAG TPA: hypothetical protein DCS54_03220 [Oribacterium sp.]|jgi:lipoprotein-anchoring transpeptidase ErfK/SrfK|nr:hypothetical protein [Oribacterium sp.]
MPFINHHLSRLFRTVMITSMLVIGFTATALAAAFPMNTLTSKGAGSGVSGWLAQSDGSWKYLDNGSPVYNAWVQVGDAWYLMDAQGIMLTGLQGWNGKIYFLNTDGKMLTGWQNVNGAECYFAEAADAAHPLGSMYISETTPDGSMVNEQGVKCAVATPAPAAVRANPTGYPSCVEVSIGEQTMYCYVNDQLVLSSPCVTGRAGAHNTTQGVHSIKAKQRNRYLEGFNDNGTRYKSYVSYWMPFYRGEGLHDARWRSSFGGSIYVNSGSHGCVNLPVDVAAALYNIVWVGMPVIVHA